MAAQDPEGTSNNGPSSTDGGASGRPQAGAGAEDQFEDDLYVPDDELLDDEELDEDGQSVEWFDEQGRRHVRRAAPEGTEEILERESARESGLPDRIERWRQRSATGAVLTAMAMGLQNAFESPQKEPAIIMETSGDPPTDLPVEAELEQLGPRQSTVRVRTWLITEDDKAPGGAPAGDAGGSAPPPGQHQPGDGPTSPPGEASNQ